MTCFLTIDDGPSSDMKSKIDLLDKKGIKAIWFCTGELLKPRADSAIKALKKGHIVGNHSYTHPNFSEISYIRAIFEIEETDSLIKEIYKKAGKKFTSKVFRFPYGNCGWGDGWDIPKSWRGRPFVYLLQRKLKKMGYCQPKFWPINRERVNYPWVLNRKDTMWTFDTMDWKLKSPKSTYRSYKKRIKYETVVSKIKKMKMKKGKNEIIMMHDYENGMGQFSSVLDALVQQGCNFSLPNGIET